jgi:hypothetical protein
VPEIERIANVATFSAGSEDRLSGRLVTTVPKSIAQLF